MTLQDEVRRRLVDDLDDDNGLSVTFPAPAPTEPPATVDNSVSLNSFEATKAALRSVAF